MLKKLRLPGLVLLLLIALFRGDRLLIFCVLLLWAIVLLIQLWNRYCFSKLTVQRSLSKTKIFLGEETQYIIEIENRKILPMFWLQINDRVTKGVDFPNPQMLTNLLGSPNNEFRDVFSLKWYEKVTRKYTVQPVRRGYYSFGKGVLKAADLFGLFTLSQEEKDRVQLMVYPRVLPIEKLGLPALNPFGRKAVSGWIYEDPANKVGVRPYEQGDAFNRINWKATARHQRLHSDVITPTFDHRLLVVLNARMMNNHWEGFNQNLFEVAVICAASVAQYSLDQGYQVGLLTNGVIYEEAPFVKIFPGKSSNQREKIMQALAMIEPFHQNDMDQMLNREMAQWEKGMTIVFITAIINERLADRLQIMQKRGFRPSVLKIGGPAVDEHADEQLARLKDLPVYHINGEALWHELENVQFSHRTSG